MGTSNHERLFGVKPFVERMFAFRVLLGYLLTNRRSPPRAGGGVTTSRGIRGPGTQHQAQADTGLYFRVAPGPRLPALGPGDRGVGRVGLVVHRPRPPGRPP